MKKKIKYGECHCGCGGKTKIHSSTDKKRGYFKGEPNKYIVAHWSRTSPVNYVVNPTTGCWEWKLYKNALGYGTIKVDGKMSLAHRYYYKCHKGEIPKGMLVLHSCDNPPCVNPEHLRIGTDKDNANDKVKRGRSFCSTKIIGEKADKIIKMYLSKRYFITEIASILKINRSTVYSVIKRSKQNV